MIAISLDPGGMHRATSQLAERLDRRMREGFEMALESIAARAKQTTSFVDRTSALRNSIQSDGVEGSIEDREGLVGTISFAATSERRATKKRGGTRRRMAGGKYYGVYIEFGTRHLKERRFVRDAIDAEDGVMLEDAIASAFRDAGFEV